MENARRTYTDFNEFVNNEPELVKSLIEMINDNNNEEFKIDVLSKWDFDYKKYEPMTEIGDIVGLIQDWGDDEEEISNLYVERTYSFNTDDGKFTLEAYGSSYRKDQSICDEKMADEITIIDEEMVKVIAKKLKAENKEKNKEKIKKQWFDFSDLYKYKSSDEILEILITQYKFPTKL
jgi:hypothetical protein